MPESEEIIEAPKELKAVKKTSRIVKPESPEPIETVTLRSHKREAPPKDELVITVYSFVLQVIRQIIFRKHFNIFSNIM